MKAIIEKPYLIFLPSIPIILLLGFLSGESVLDLNIHDTYYLIASKDLAIWAAILFGIIGLGYWIVHKAKRTLSIRLIWIHIGVTIGGTMTALILSQLYREHRMDFEFNNGLTLIILSILLITVVGQIIFPINITYGILNKKNKTSSEHLL